jgi:hypothetical protein
MLFDAIARSDATPARHDEERFAFLNRSASRYFGYVRELMEEWFSHVPAEAQVELRGALRADDRQSESAFWELYLHEAYLRSGYAIEIHPELPGLRTHPDFRMACDDQVFYLEAVSVGQLPAEIAEDRRLDGVYQILANLRIENFALEVSTYRVGPRPLSTRGLRGALQKWLTGLDPERVALEAESAEAAGLDRLPEMPWNDDGWSLIFHALPLREQARGKERSALGMMGPGEATVVDNVSGIIRVLDSKHGKYGVLDAPLVVAVLSNTKYPTRDYEIEQALFGISARRPAESVEYPDSMFQEGFWLTKRGWRYRDTPQVVTAAELKPWTVTKTQPKLWQTLEPRVPLTTQPEWLARMMIGAEAVPAPASDLPRHFDLEPDWPGMAEPDFDIS